MGSARFLATQLHELRYKSAVVHGGLDRAQSGCWEIREADDRSHIWSDGGWRM